MSFTQEKMINIRPQWARVSVPQSDHCDGCECNCRLGYSYNPDKCHVYPTIGELVITHYIDENYRDMFAGEVVLGTRTETDQKKLYAKIRAGKIASLCDHYKTR